MPDKETGNGWTAEFVDGVVVFEFLPEMKLESFGEEAYPVYEQFLTEQDADGLVTIVEIDEPFTPETFEVWEKTAQRAVEGGISRWATVADGIKALSLRSKMDTAGLTIDVFDDRSAAIAWARSGNSE